MRTIGVAETAIEAMAKRLLTRVAFGKRIADHSIWEQRIAKARIEIEMTRLLCLKAADIMDKAGNKAAQLEIAMVKVMAPTMALSILDDAVQAHGGGGVSQDFHLAHAWAAMRTLRLADGPDEVHNRAIARNEFGKYAELPRRLRRRKRCGGNLSSSNEPPERADGVCCFMKAAILFEVGQPIEVADVAIDTLGAREVLIRTTACGVCRSDLHFVDGAYPTPLPFLPGHEAAGVVEAIGSDVTTIKVGDHVVTCLSIFCGHCEYCVTGRMSLCIDPGTKRPRGGTPRLTLNGQPVHPMTQLGGHAEQMLVHEHACVAIDRDMPLDRAALIGCGGGRRGRGRSSTPPS